MKLKLSDRMKLIVDMCEACDTIADVGTDHGKVAIAVANKFPTSKVIAIDNKKGPIEACIKNSLTYLENRNNFTAIVSDGIKSLDKSTEVGIIITGIGYDLMKEILQDINEYNFKYLVLSPHTKVNELVTFLESKNIKVIENNQITEDNKIYNIIKAKKYES